MARWASAVPGASVPVPSGAAGVCCVAAAGIGAVVRGAGGGAASAWRGVSACWRGPRGAVSAPRTWHDRRGEHDISGDCTWCSVTKNCSSNARSASVLRTAREAAGTVDVPVDRLRAGEVSTSELAELLSPSLFADERVVVLEAAAEAGKDAVALIADAAADLPPGTMLVVVHSGGGRAKALADSARRSSAPRCIRVPRITKAAGAGRLRPRASSATLRVKVSDDTVTAVLDAVGSDLRELARRARSSSPTPAAQVDAAAVRRYHSRQGRGEGLRHRRQGGRRATWPARPRRCAGR